MCRLWPQTTGGTRGFVWPPQSSFYISNKPLDLARYFLAPHHRIFIREGGLGSSCSYNHSHSTYSTMRPTLACAAAAAAAVQCSAFSLSHLAAVPAATGRDRASSSTFTSSTLASRGTHFRVAAERICCASAAGVPNQACTCACDKFWSRENTCVTQDLLPLAGVRTQCFQYSFQLRPLASPNDCKRGVP